MSAKTLLRAKALLSFLPWLAIVLVGIVSLVPGTLRPHTGLPGSAEHFLAYLITGFVLATQRRSMAYTAVATGLLCLYSGGLEILQNWIPGRDPDFLGFVASSAGAICGAVSYVMIRRICRPDRKAAIGKPAA